MVNISIAASTLNTLLSNPPCHISQSRNPDMMFIITSTISITLCLCTIFFLWMYPKHPVKKCDCKEDCKSRKSSTASDASSASSASSSETLFQANYSMTQQVSVKVKVNHKKPGYNLDRPIVVKEIQYSATSKTVDASEKGTRKSSFSSFTSTLSKKKEKKPIERTRVYYQ